MRSGFSTSACAAAAAAAATESLLRQFTLEKVTIDLPAVKGATFLLARCEVESTGVCCGVVKDAGDDPDATDGLEIQAFARRAASSGIILKGGMGVGVVTLAGLPVLVGQPAINPASKRLILHAVRAVMNRYPSNLQQGLEIEIRVPDGEKAAGETMNPKLGIVGGISILGTDGLVRPYSAPAFRASLYFELRVAYKNGCIGIGLATGKRSSAYLRAELKEASELGVLDVGDELGYPIEQAAKMGFHRIVIGGMIGKLSKLAQGRFQTHVSDGEIDFDFLSQTASTQGASQDLSARIRTARTAHQVQNWLRTEGINLEPALAGRAAEQVFSHVGKKLDVAVYIFALDGRLLGKSERMTENGY
jgi:cobalt-precorrin-5B (C1)-methyltransferase